VVTLEGREPGAALALLLVLPLLMLARPF